jgi:hypothetical protein
MKFVRMNFSDNDSIVCRNQDILNGIGTIKLELSYGKIGDYVPNPTYYKGPVDQSPFHRAHQAELELDHRVA